MRNCEHVIASSARLALSLLQHCPHLHLLATSREGLRLTGEILWRVHPLSYPPFPSSFSPESLLCYDAVRLFCERAAAAEPHFRITTHNMAALARICYCLDGNPLALELAAANLSVFSVDQIATYLDERFHILVDQSKPIVRHQTLQATFDWSYTLLSEAEQTMLQRLSVFGGSWTVEAVEGICTDEKINHHKIVDLLTQLLHKSWIVAEGIQEGEEVRYRLLETIRKYAHEHLTQEDMLQLHRKHWAWYLAFIEEATCHLHGAEQVRWLKRIEYEHDNLRLALKRSLATKYGEITIRIAAALGPFWVRRCLLSEGRAWYELLLSSPDITISSRIILLQHIVEILRFQGEYTRIRTLLKECLILLKGLDVPANLAEACCSLGWAAFYQGDCEEAIEYCTEGLSLFQKAGDQSGITRCLSGLALVAMLQQEYPRARTLLQEVVSLRRALLDSAELAYALNAQARVALLQGEKTLACEACQEALHLVCKLRQPFGTAYSLEVIAALAGTRGNKVDAVQLFGTASALRTAIGIPIPPALQGSTRTGDASTPCPTCRRPL